LILDFEIRSWIELFGLGLRFRNLIFASKIQNVLLD
jgi:hypothetical protein